MEQDASELVLGAALAIMTIYMFARVAWAYLFPKKNSLCRDRLDNSEVEHRSIRSGAARRIERDFKRTRSDG